MTDSKNSTKSGRFGEILGNYDPRKSLESLKADRIKHWLSMGAGVTGSVNNLLIKKGIIRGKKTHVGADYVAKVAEPVIETSPEPEVVTEAPVEEVAVAETPASETPADAPATEEAPQASSETPSEPVV